MTASHFGFVASFCFGCAFLVASAPAGAQEFANSQLPIYREYRNALLAEGWKPDGNWGLKLASGKPLYRFPEVLCGPKICNARWSRKGEEKLVTILRGDGVEEYRVAPR